MLAIATDRQSKLMTRLSGINLFMKKMEMEDEGFVPIGLDMGENVGEFDQEKDSKFALIIFDHLS